MIRCMTWLSVSTAVLLAGCSRERAKDEQTAHRSMPGVATNEPDGSISSRRVESALRDLTPLRKGTPDKDSLLAFLREDPSRFLSLDVILQIDRNPQIMRNPEMERIVYEFYAAERAAGRFWRKGAWLLAMSGNQARASFLLEDWKSSPPSGPASLGVSRADMETALQEPRLVLAFGVFNLGESSAIEEIWRTFPALPEADQAIIAQAAKSFLDVAMVRDIINCLDASKSDVVRHQMAYAANNILYHIIMSTSASSDWVDRETKPLLQELERRGAVLDFLEKVAKK